jgi:hypothetical protein
MPAAMPRQRRLATLIRMLLRTVIALAGLAVLSPVPAANARPSTTKPSYVLNVHVTLTDTRIVLGTHSAPRGVEARFIIKNVTAKTHNITLDGRKTAGGGQRGFSRTLKPHQREVVRVFLDRRGKFPYLGSLPADRGKPGMSGFFVIG